jgi:hypothetical protein
MNRSKGLIATAVVAVALLAAALLWRGSGDNAPRLDIAGHPAPLPRAGAEAELVLPEALETARAQARRLGVRAFVVHRRGHRIFEHFAHGASGASLVDGGELAGVLLALALHRPEDDAADAAQAAKLVSERLWQPLRAQDARLLDRGGGPRRCCVEARLDDWMRVGDLLAGTGAYLGERIVSADAVRQVLSRQQASSQGDEPFLARDGTAFDLGGGARLWLAPRRALVMLVWADGDVALDTLLPNIVLRGLNDVSPAIGGDISDLVPGH